MFHKSVSLADQIFERLEEDILAEKYERGEIITEANLCEELNVSRTPVREALRHLEQEHIIEDTGKGMRVLGITIEDANIIYTIRERIEGLAAAEAARKATEEDIRELEELEDLQIYYYERENSEKVRQLDSDFHEMIYRLADCAPLYDTLVRLHRKIQKFRLKLVETKSRAKESTDEHTKILEAIKAHDPQAAEKAMADHCANAHRRLLEKYGNGEI